MDEEEKMLFGCGPAARPFLSCCSPFTCCTYVTDIATSCMMENLLSGLRMKDDKDSRSTYAISV